MRALFSFFFVYASVCVCVSQCEYLWNKKCKEASLNKMIRWISKTIEKLSNLVFVRFQCNQYHYVCSIQHFCPNGYALLWWSPREKCMKTAFLDYRMSRNFGKSVNSSLSQLVAKRSHCSLTTRRMNIEQTHTPSHMTHKYQAATFRLLCIDKEGKKRLALLGTSHTIHTCGECLISLLSRWPRLGNFNEFSLNPFWFGLTDRLREVC